MKPLIVQIFNVSWNTVTDLLPKLSSLGYTHIQLSPTQRHCPHNLRWARLYQPHPSNDIGNSLGTKKELQKLIDVAHSHNIKIISDVVLHHRTPCPLCNPSWKSFGWWKKVAFNRQKYRKEMSQASPEYARFHLDEFGVREDVTSASVLQEHINLLNSLIEMGIDGFRFDAAKHIPADYFKTLLNNVNSGDKLNYCEALDGSVDVCNEYVDRNMKALDFPMVFSLIHAFGVSGDLRSLEHTPCLPWDSSVCLADCHDSKVGDSYKFGDERDSILAICYLLARGVGIPLVYFSFIEEKRVQAAVQFYQATFGAHCSYRNDLSTKVLLVMQRSDFGLVFINKSADWINWNSCQINGVKRGIWKEISFNFKVEISEGNDGNTWISKWGNDKQCFSIGPREILFLIHEQ